MERFAQTARRIASNPGKLEKIAVLASYFRTLDDADLIAAARFFTGSPFAARDRRTLSIGGRTIVAVARRVWGFDDAALGSSYRATGDLGAALGPLVRPPVDAMLFSDRLTPATLDVLFGESRRRPENVRTGSARRSSNASCAPATIRWSQPTSSRLSLEICASDCAKGSCSMQSRRPSTPMPVRFAEA